MQDTQCYRDSKWLCGRDPQRVTAMKACCKFSFKLQKKWLKVLLCSLKEKRKKAMLIWKKLKSREDGNCWRLKTKLKRNEKRIKRYVLWRCVSNLIRKERKN